MPLHHPGHNADEGDDVASPEHKTRIEIEDAERLADEAEAMLAVLERIEAKLDRMLAEAPATQEAPADGKS
jgi:putative hemolysin